MSSNWLSFIPLDPNQVPDVAARREVLELYRSFVPRADEVEERVSAAPEFVGAGPNLERITCPVCGRQIEFEWWGAAMNNAYSVGYGFTNLMVNVPCCGEHLSLNDLQYDWPAGFARFELRARNPDVPNLPLEQTEMLEKTLGCKLKTIWTHI